MSQSLDPRLKRLLFRSWRRGTKEADLLFGCFAEAHLAGFTPSQLNRYEALLEVSDALIFDWASGRATPPAAQDSDVLRLLLGFRLPRSPA
ncbi:MAG TPA: succinate dehydrogenase assembly factor 2 [Stellaceae bacterium]|nr:succinate dehydrogenase assembly factor 2 [Stellaceae bacterium]